MEIIQLHCKNYQTIDAILKTNFHSSLLENHATTFFDYSQLSSKHTENAANGSVGSILTIHSCNYRDGTDGK